MRAVYGTAMGREMRAPEVASSISHGLNSAGNSASRVKYSLASEHSTSEEISLPDLELYVSLFDVRTGKRQHSDDHPGH